MWYIKGVVLFIDMWRFMAYPRVFLSGRGGGGGGGGGGGTGKCLPFTSIILIVNVNTHRMERILLIQLSMDNLLACDFCVCTRSCMQ